MSDGKLTPEQIANWRKVWVGIIGPYAMLAPDEEVQAWRDAMQARVGVMEREREGKQGEHNT